MGLVVNVPEIQIPVKVITSKLSQFYSGQQVFSCNHHFIISPEHLARLASKVI